MLNLAPLEEGPEPPQSHALIPDGFPYRIGETYLGHYCVLPSVYRARIDNNPGVLRGSTSKRPGNPSSCFTRQLRSRFSFHHPAVAPPTGV
jgi:hypothetical protein